MREVFIPKPSDTLHTYSDYSASEKAVGGRLEIHREENGKIKKLMGGHFSCRVNRHQQHWHPCEGEFLAARLVLEHFAPFIRENKINVFTIMIINQLFKHGEGVRREHSLHQQEFQHSYQVLAQ